MKRILILGGGYAAIWLKRFFSAHADAEILCISNKSYHSYHGFTGEALSGIVQIESRQADLKQIFGNNFFLEAQVNEIDITNQIVIAEKGNFVYRVAYDELIIATGTYRFMSVPGLAEHALGVKAPNAVTETKNRIAASQQDILILGGGLAAVEIAGHLKEAYPKRTVKLIHRGGQLAKELDTFPKLRQNLETELLKMNVEIHNHSQIEEVTADGIVVNGEFIPGISINCLGQDADILLGSEALPRNKRNQILTDLNLRVRGYENIWAAGDIAQVQNQHGKLAPQNALWAIMQGKLLGINLSRKLKGKTLKEFNFNGLGHAASIRPGKAIAELYGFQATGWLAWVMRLSFFLYFQGRISPAKSKQSMLNLLQYRQTRLKAR